MATVSDMQVTDASTDSKPVEALLGDINCHQSWLINTVQVGACDCVWYIVESALILFIRLHTEALNNVRSE